MMNKYYRLICEYKGHHYFKVSQSQLKEPVVKITFGSKKKKGRPFCPGITLINYTTFISSYAYGLDKGYSVYNLEKITKHEYDHAFSLILKQLNSKSNEKPIIDCIN